MSSPIAGLRCRYEIGKTNSKGAAGAFTVVGYNSTQVPKLGVPGGYLNTRQERKGRIAGVDYQPEDQIERDYGEPAPVFATEFFWQNIDVQAAKWVNLGCKIVDADNLDTWRAFQRKIIIDRLHKAGLQVMLKNPHLYASDAVELLRHPAIVGILAEYDEDLSIDDLDQLRGKAGLPDLPIRLTTYDDQRPWAIEQAEAAKDLIDVGITYDAAEEEYGGEIEDILLPRIEGAAPMTNQDHDPVEPTYVLPWVADMRDDLGKYSTGPDVPRLALSVARAFPDDADLAKYVLNAGNSTAWCGIYVAAKLAKAGIRPPLDGNGVKSFMYVDAWKKLPGGTPIPVGEQQPGDVCMFIHPDWSPSLHHVNFYDGDGYYIGGNQAGRTVTRSKYGSPTHVMRPPRPGNYVEPLPMLMLNSVGERVKQLQLLLGMSEVDGEFGPNTEAAVIAYQQQHGLEVDGIVGPVTWARLMEKLPAPKPLSAAQVSAITGIASTSAIARYSWPGRGRAPIGYIKGMCVMYAEIYVQRNANFSSINAMLVPIGASAKDALAHYGVRADNRQDILRNLFALMIGLGMRESSGNFTEGRDTSASNTSADTAEAGLFQQSWNSHATSEEIGKVMAQYASDSRSCWASIFSEGITPKQTANYGSGQGLVFQKLAKSCPAFAVEACAIAMRSLYNHWGPLVTKAAELRPEALELLDQVEAVIDAIEPDDQLPEPEPQPEPEPDEEEQQPEPDDEGDEEEETPSSIFPDIPDGVIRFVWPLVQPVLARLTVDQVIALKHAAVAGQLGPMEFASIIMSGGSIPQQRAADLQPQRHSVPAVPADPAPSAPQKPGALSTVASSAGVQGGVIGAITAILMSAVGALPPVSGEANVTTALAGGSGLLAIISALQALAKRGKELTDE